MARHTGPVLVDTNVILEAFRIGAWRALSSGYALETVEDCVTETQTGFQRRRAEQRIDAGALRASLACVHAVSDRHLAALAVLAPDIALDVGERSLWAYAATRTDGWVLCGPDKASLRLGLRLGYRDRLVALERLLADAGYRPKLDLKVAYTARWLEMTLGQLVLSEGGRI
ncbi:MAG: hypothetical protein WAS73_01420 [Defluviicoccus sp.]